MLFWMYTGNGILFHEKWKKFNINKKWFDPRNISILLRSCSPYLEHLSIIFRPFYLPSEFLSIIVSAVYIPPQSDTGLALSKLHDVLSGYINKHPDAAFIIVGDFNKANLRQVIPDFYQYVSCPTRGPNTLYHCYSQFKNAYNACLLPAFGKSDHAAKGSFRNPPPKACSGTRTADPPPLQPLQQCWQQSYVYFSNTTSGYGAEYVQSTFVDHGKSCSEWNLSC